QRPKPRVDPVLRRGPGRAAGLQDRRRTRGQSGRPAHPGRRTPPSFPLNGLTAAVFRAPVRYDAARRGRPPPDPTRLLQHPLDLHAPGLRLCDPGRDHPPDPDRDRPRQTASRPELRIPPRHGAGDRRGQDARRLAHLHLRPEHRRIDSEVVGPLAGRRLDRPKGGEPGPEDRIRGAVPPLEHPSHERHDPDLRVLRLQPGREGPGAEHVPDREFPRGPESRGDPWSDLVRRARILPRLTAHTLMVWGRFRRPVFELPSVLDATGLLDKAFGRAAKATATGPDRISRRSPRPVAPSDGSRRSTPPCGRSWSQAIRTWGRVPLSGRSPPVDRRSRTTPSPRNGFRSVTSTGGWSVSRSSTPRASSID